MRRTSEMLAAVALTLALLAPAAALAARQDAADCDAARNAARAEIEAACPCEGPTGHGGYVKCVTQKLREMTACEGDAGGKRSCGTLSRQCAAEIRRAAARSACGKPADMVTCCVPKQRDCTGDAALGDGKPEGKCSGSTRACDRVEDCLVPKCQLAATAERCELVGGTVGRGRDCSTACTP